MLFKLTHKINVLKLIFVLIKYVNFNYILKRVNCELRPGRSNGPIGESKTPTFTRPKKVGPILSHGPPIRTKAQTCPSRFKETCSTSQGGLSSKPERLAQQVCEACSARKGGRTSLL